MSLNQISSGGNSQRARWMVVDDNDSVLQLLADFLEMFGVAEVCRFHSGIDALEAFAAAPADFQFVVTDLEMPGIDGVELCQRLRAMSPRLKILLATGSKNVTEIDAMRSGFCGLLPKPFPLPALREAVQAAGALNGLARGN